MLNVVLPTDTQNTFTFGMAVGHSLWTTNCPWTGRDHVVWSTL